MRTLSTLLLFLSLLNCIEYRVKDVEIVTDGTHERELYSLFTEYLVGKNMFTVSRKDVEKVSNLSGWIDRCEIRKIFPDKVKIIIYEKKPLVIWKIEDNFYLISDKGSVIGLADNLDEKLPKVVCWFDHDIFSVIAYILKRMQTKIVRVTCVDEETLKVFTEDSVTVWFLQKELDEQLNFLKDFYSIAKGYFSQIDFRAPSGVILRGRGELTYGYR